jgi:hypothetical protein
MTRIENRESLLADKIQKLYDHAVLGLIYEYRFIGQTGQSKWCRTSFRPVQESVR